jgi:hypothetical protein
MRSIEATHNLFAVSAGVREAALNTAATLDTTMLLAMDALIKPDFRNERNANEATGYSEATRVYKRGKTGSLAMNIEKASPQHFAFVLAYLLGNCSTAAAGATGYLHTITPREDWLDVNRSNPTFTAAMRYAQMEKRRWYSGMVKSATVQFPQDDWAKINADVAFTGRYDSNVVRITLTAKDDAVSLTLNDGTDDYAVAGATAAARLNNIDYVRALIDGAWVDVVVTAASDAEPAILTIEAPGSDTEDVTYEVVFIATEPAWATFPAQVVESPLYVTEFSLNIGGIWTGAALAGGRTISGEVKSFEWQITNEGADPEFRPGGTGTYANYVRRVAREQTIIIQRDLMDMLLRQLEETDGQFAIRAKAVGAEYEDGHNYEVDLIWPLCQVINPDVTVENKLLGESATIAPLWHPTYGSVIARVKNKVEKYAAAS